MAYEVVVKDLAPELLAIVRESCPVADLSRAMPQAFGKVMEVITAQQIEATGGAVAVYQAWTPDSVEVEIGFTVAAAVREEQGVEPGHLPGGQTLMTVHVGPYEDLQAAYQAIQEYADENDLTLADTMWERYLTDPAVEPDLSKHVTEVYWPLAC